MTSLSATLFVDAALVGRDVRERVQIDIDTGGRIAHVACGVDPPPGAHRLAGTVVPGLANVHSHAFQRAMAGMAERAGPEGDSFWSWREVMYRFLASLTPDDVQAVAGQLYVECLLHGYTSVAEFHYLHNAPDGSAYDDLAELSWSILSGAETAGIGLVLLPVLYRWSGFAGVPATAGQRRFVLDIDDYAALCQRLVPLTPIGVAPHSLRAVSPEDLAAAVAIADGLGRSVPLHIHAAEQMREVEECLGWSGRRPVEWLLDTNDIGQRWCLIHATHMTDDEAERLARSGATVGLCQTTEANLGDGLFGLRRWLAAGGRFGVGSDSNVGTSPIEELRWLEYARRLETRTRNVSETRPGTSVAASLLMHAARDGAAAMGREAGEIAVGRLADLVVLDADHPSLVGRRGMSVIDAWMFCGNANPVRDVMVAGRWVVRDGLHIQGAATRAAFAATMRRLGAL